MSHVSCVTNQSDVIIKWFCNDVKSSLCLFEISASHAQSLIGFIYFTEFEKYFTKKIFTEFG